ncbi:uncharacterized protein CC84DRAFT_1261748 [Paraphaeosphaeria sporulosa]|uniref:Uncharacterized protein n=1 Tax=Paraphaeosphaeria sporulosa TaxID=1460663 RepID=A0A177C8P8_9PLEO|nr:uncharacterized protein CC84DRAFT_1261748 [Paraphaeosphaeria sporulosa]OAG03127.1 hypothetical protein CC84DRAFT_1261748 [Paraphaeosphaeria sporulosa]
MARLYFYLLSFLAVVTTVTALPQRPLIDSIDARDPQRPLIDELDTRDPQHPLMDSIDKRDPQRPLIDSIDRRTANEAVVADGISKACGIAYLTTTPDSYVFLVANTCGLVHPDVGVTSYRAVNEDCKTCWFFENAGCTGGIAWHGLIAPKEEISFPPARSYICRV